MSDLLSLFDDLDDSSNSRENYVRAPFNYTGSKERSLERILPLLPNRNKFIDVFGGSGVVSLNRKPCKLHVYNDRHSGLVAFYRCIRDRLKLEDLIDRLELTPMSREEFLWSLKNWENVDDDVERAARWYTMLQFSFGSVCRNFGRSVDAKVLRNQHSTILKHFPLFGEIHQKVRFWQIENLDWRQMLRDYDAFDAVLYLDPPYYGCGAGAYRHAMSDEASHRELLDKIFMCEGFVAVSGYANSLYDCRGWTARHEWDVRQTINNNADDKILDNAKEVLWIYDPSQR